MSEIIKYTQISKPYQSIAYYPLYIGEDLLERMNTADNQIVWGRRGTGKTHLLKAFSQMINESQDEYKLAYYLSCDAIKMETPVDLVFDNDVQRMKYFARETYKAFLINLVEQIIDAYQKQLERKYAYNEKSVQEKEEIQTETLVLAPGHSARETFAMLFGKKVPMEAKSFAVGVRAEHPQELINHSQYGDAKASLPAAAYKLTAKLPDGRGVYSFCMCPGGYVVNASSEEGYLAVNGMSYHARDSRNANSAIVVTVTPEDFESDHPLAGIAFQRELEKAAYEAGKGKIPVQRYGDFYRSVTGKEKDKTEAEVWYQGHEPCMKGAYEETDLAGIFPAKISSALVDGMEDFNKKIRGFSHPLSILSGVESRTSSPVRIVRDNHSLESVIGGLYPCGEGAGYAGGITSAAADGIKIAEKIRQKYAPFL